MNEEELTNLAALAVCVYFQKRKTRSKRKKRWLSNRNDLNLVQQLCLEPADWRINLRMDETAYNNLLQMITPYIKKRDTNMRQAITPNKRLTATLRYLASGCSYEKLKFSTAISPQALGRIIPDTCKAILRCLQNYMKMPNNIEEWKAIAQRFEEKWNFPHCLGAWDGKHVWIIPPPGSESFFLNYKHFHSIVLMACVNADYEFIWVEVGTNGGISDDGVLKNITCFKKLSSGQLNLPPTKSFEYGVANLPYVFIGDKAFPLRIDFMKPFSEKTLTEDQRVFNCRLSRARSVVENVFRIMANRFRIFQSSINLSLDRIDLVVLTCCLLHNFLRKTCPTYTVEEMETEEENKSSIGNMLTSLQGTSTRNASTSAKHVRETFKEYFVSGAPTPRLD